jgi:hypothetical protein
MTWCRACLPLAALWLAASAGAEPVTAGSLTDDHVRDAARAIVDELYRAQAPGRFWDPESWDPDTDGQQAQVGGYTPLVVLALLYAGESYQSPGLRDAVAHLEGAPLQGTYAIAVRAHVWAQLPGKFRQRLEADTRWLMGAFNPEARGWGYEARPRSDWYDNSLAQYGALGLWEAAKRGAAIPDAYWASVEQRYVGNQRSDGGWNYRGNQPVTGSMTAAGLTALFITQDFLHARDGLDLDRPRDRPHEQAIARGLAWMDRHFSATENPGRDSYFFYYLYGVERVGLASGYRTFGGRDWFRAGAAEIINRLCTVDADTGRVRVRPRLCTGRPIQLRQLAFGLMFLSRGRVPIAVNKLGGLAQTWNNRPRDVANLTRWLAQETETELSWQIVDAADEPETWLRAPLLYLASDEPLSDADRDRIKRYLDLGGLLLAVNEGRGKAFAQSVLRAGTAMYPQYAWRTLRPDHWAYTLHFPVRSRRPPLQALSNGVRDLIILAPDRDLSAPLQVHDEKSAAFPVAANVYFYASEMNRPRPRLHRPATAPGWPPEARIVRASYEGNWNPEPLALDVPVAPLESIPALDPRPDLVVVSGTDAHEFTEAERSAVRAYVEAGGVILFETAGGRGPFAQAAEQMCRAALAGIAEEPRLLTTDRIITGEGLGPSGRNLSRVRYRPYTVEVLGARETRPRLQGMFVGGTARVLFSNEDLSNALLDQLCWGVSGYAPASARELFDNIVLHALALRRANG